LLMFLLIVGVNAQEKELQQEAPTHEEPVSVGAMLVDGDKPDEKKLVIKTNIMEGYHIYAFVPAGEAYIKTEQGIEVPAGIELIGDWDKSAPAPYPGKDKLLVYKGQTTFKHTVKVSDTANGSTIKCYLYYQCCNADICFPPKKKEFELIVKN
ncbi:MAG: protein-disulfide reductase DsbD N-terminal domain-containing protein, partial [Bacteroidales bacterium]|nr:protein-disulfide reductase DsbD N-terminal domain-containing protein [Bacteroidales bacterium]